MNLNISKSLILIVDDNYQNLQFLGNILHEKGFDTALSSSGIKALDFVKKRKPDLILLDIMMPEMDGFEVCRRLKSDNSNTNIPVIFLTAKTDIKDVVKAFEIGGVDYITKPFNSLELLARVNTHIKLKKAIEEIQTLRGIIPICSNCGKIRDDEGYWKRVDVYLQEHANVKFSHGLCADCAETLYGDEEWFGDFLKEQQKKDKD